jgi:GT2 family glycosyltransferase
MPKAPKVAVIILNFCTPQDTINCLDATRNSSYEHLNVIVLDNASPDGSGKLLAQQLRGVSFFQFPRNLGYAGGNNEGIRLALETNADYILILNPDVRLGPNAIQHYVTLMEALPDAAAANSIQLSSPGGPIDASFRVSVLRSNPNSERWLTEENQPDHIEVEHLYGAALFLRSSAIRKVGAFDPLFFAYSEEVDLCRRLRRNGYKLLVTRHEPVVHLRSHNRLKPVDPWRLYLRLRGYCIYELKNTELSFRSNLKRVLLPLIGFVVAGKCPQGHQLSAHPFNRPQALRVLIWIIFNAAKVAQHRHLDMVCRPYAD